MPLAHFGKIQRGEPSRDEQIDNYLTTIRNMAEAGIHLLGYNFIATDVWRTDLGAGGPGGVRVTAYDQEKAHLDNAFAAYKLTLGASQNARQRGDDVGEPPVLPRRGAPRGRGTRCPACPAPDDPPVDEPVGGAARIFTSPASRAKGLRPGRRDRSRR